MSACRWRSGEPPRHLNTGPRDCCPVFHLLFDCFLSQGLTWPQSASELLESSCLSLSCCVPKRTEVELCLAHIWCSLVCLSTSPPEAQAQLLPLGSFLGMRNSKDQAKLTPKVTFTFYNPVSFIIVYAITLSTRRMEQRVCCSRWNRLAEAGQTSFSLVSYFSDHFRKLSGL